MSVVVTQCPDTRTPRLFVMKQRHKGEGHCHPQPSPDQNHRGPGPPAAQFVCLRLPPSYVTDGTSVSTVSRHSRIIGQISESYIHLTASYEEPLCVYALL